MARVAVLISGEYRKFDITRKTMSFLDDPGVDVYVSTWSRTNYSSPRVGLDCTEIVTEDKILSDLNRPAVIRIDRPPGRQVYSRYNCEMIDRWLAGWKLIQDSGIEYDHVMITRPDLYYQQFNHTTEYNLSRYTDEVGFAWATSMHLGKLTDLTFLSSYENISRIMQDLNVDMWQLAPVHDWHVWWFDFVQSKVSKIVNADDYGNISFCRYWANESHTFADMMNFHHDWRDLRLLHQCDLWGPGFAGKAWSAQVLLDAEQKWDSGYFEKYQCVP